MKNNKGITLIEMLVVLIILGIMLPIMSKFLLNMGRASLRAEKAAQSLANQQSVPLTGQVKVSWAKVNEASSSTPILCFKNAQTYGCDPEHPCAFVNGNWERKNMICEDGMFLIN